MTEQQLPSPISDSDDHQQSSADLEIPGELLFRFHVLPFAVLAPFILLSPLGGNLALLIFASEFGLWGHPLNLIFSLFVMVAIPVLEVMKRTINTDDHTFRLAQILLWWFYWGSILLALTAGTYRGP